VVAARARFLGKPLERAARAPCQTLTLGFDPALELRTAVEIKAIEERSRVFGKTMR